MANAPKSTAVLKLAGTYRKDRHAERSPLPVEEAKAPTMPGFLSGASAKEWKRVIKVLKTRGNLSLSNMATITQYCLMWGELQDNYNGEGEPMGAAFHTSFRLVCAELAITPVSQIKISVPDKPKETEGFGAGL